MAMDKTLAVQIGKSFESGLEQVKRLRRGEWAFGKDLRKVFFRILHHGKQDLSAAHAAASCMEEAEQVRMRQLGSLSPPRDLLIMGNRMGDQQLDCGFPRLRA